MIRFYLSLLISTFILKGAGAQCTANAGPDQHICPTTLQNDTVLLGGNPTAQGGVAPYTYSWSFSDSLISGTRVYASMFLDDTTAANPGLVSHWLDEMRFTLKVTDSTGATCYDTVWVSYSLFSVHLGQYSMNINQGDTVTLPHGPNVGSNLPIVEYLWRPQHGMIDSTGLYPVVAPLRDTDYYVVATDSAGCVMEGGVFVFVKVNSLGQGKEPNQRGFELYPNPAHGRANLRIPEAGPFEVQIMEVSGRVVDRFEVWNQAGDVHHLSLPAGFYLLRVKQEGEIAFTQKLRMLE